MFSNIDIGVNTNLDYDIVYNSNILINTYYIYSN